MGKFQKGILGGFSGTVGTVVGASWRGMDILRSRPKRTSRIPTEKQAEQRLRFKTVAEFLRPIRPLLRSFFGQPASEKSRSNLASSYHMQEALQGIYPAIELDFERVIISKGELLGVENPIVVPQNGATLQVDWTDNSGQGLAKTDDGLIIAVFNPDKELWDSRTSAAARATSTYSFQLPASWSGDMVHCYLSIASLDEMKYANSVYFGPLVLL